MDDISYNLLPEHIQDRMRLYVEQGIKPGGFCTAVLSNDLKGAFRRADHINVARMRDIVCWLYSQCPATAQGNAEKVREWCESGGLQGRHARTMAG